MCEDNNFAIHSKVTERKGYKSITKVVSQFNCHIEASDTTDVFEIYKITQQILKKMKKSGGPGFLHLKYYRYLEHVGVEEDFNFGYRLKEEFLKWKRVDPLLSARRHLIKSGVKEKNITVLEKVIDKNLASSLTKARKAPYPKEKELFTHIYGS